MDLSQVKERINILEKKASEAFGRYCEFREEVETLRTQELVIAAQEEMADFDVEVRAAYAFGMAKKSGINLTFADIKEMLQTIDHEPEATTV